MNLKHGFKFDRRQAGGKATVTSAALVRAILRDGGGRLMQRTDSGGWRIRAADATGTVGMKLVAGDVVRKLIALGHLDSPVQRGELNPYWKLTPLGQTFAETSPERLAACLEEFKKL